MTCTKKVYSALFKAKYTTKTEKTYYLLSFFQLPIFILQQDSFPAMALLVFFPGAAGTGIIGHDLPGISLIGHPALGNIDRLLAGFFHFLK